MRICVTGATGFIGTHLCRRLTADGHTVSGIDLWPPESDARLDHFVRGDIRDPVAVGKALEGCDALLSLAAAHHDFGIDEPTYYSVNEAGSQVLLDACDRLGIRRVCWFSSCAVFGDAEAPRTEVTPPSPNNPYGASKLAGEKVFERWAARGEGRSALVIRPTITFGPGNVANMYSLIRQIASRKFFVAGKASNYKSLSYVENLVEATVHLWRDCPPGMHIYNFVEKPDLTSREIAETIALSLGRRSPGPTVPMGLALLLAKPFDLVTAMTGKDLGISSMRVRKLFGWETRFEADKLLATGFRSPVPLREGLRRMVNWWLDAGSSTKPTWRQPPSEIQPIRD
jgi:nucleoside-diphosphate-sugar epimerase